MNTALEVRELRCGYGQKVVVPGVDLSLGAGTVTTLIGPNGSGKSTLAKSIYGLIPPIAGDVFLDGVRLDPVPSKLRRAGVAFLPQGRRVFEGLDVLEHLELARLVVRRPMDGEPGSSAKWEDIVPAVANLLDRPGSVLSGGQQQMVGLAMALEAHPRVVLLDEPVAGLSPDLRASVYRSIRRMAHDDGLAVLTIEHDLHTALSFVDHVLVMTNGEIVHRDRADTPGLEQMVRTLLRHGFSESRGQ